MSNFLAFVINVSRLMICLKDYMCSLLEKPWVCNLSVGDVMMHSVRFPIILFFFKKKQTLFG